MEKLFKKKFGRKRDSTHNSSDNDSSKINEEVDFPQSSALSSSSASKLHNRKNDNQNENSNQLEISSTWPIKLELVSTTSRGGTCQPLEAQDPPPSISGLYKHIPYDSSNNLSLTDHYNTPQIGYNYKDTISTDISDGDTEVNDNHGSENKDDGISETNSNLGSLSNDHHKEGYPVNGPESSTLVEAALDKDEAKDRHVRFHDYVAESAALIDRMLGVEAGHQQQQNHDPIGDFIQSQNSHHQDDELEMNRQPTLGRGGSVLGSLMKLEAKRTESIKRKQRRSPKKIHLESTKNTVRPSSLSDFPVHFDTDPLSEESGNHRFSLPRVNRPSMANRPKSWLAGVASSKYVVPSLQKQKKKLAPSFSRRSSNDSMFTTASQFEPITLEDRIRITFEIANILQKQEFLRKLCKSLMLYGCPAHQLEYAMRQVSRTLSVNAEYVYIPNVMLVTFIDSNTHTTETHFIRQSQTFEMHRLSDIYRLEKLVSHGEVSVDEALEFIDKVSAQPRLYPIWLNPFVYALAAFSGCILFFGGRWKEAGVAAALSMVFATNEIFSAAIASFQPIWEITVCILIGFVARGIQKYDFCFTPIAFSSFIIVLPGYPMAVAIIELVSRQLLCGVVRMVYAIIYSFLLGYGVSMGSELYSAMDKNSDNTPSDACKLASSATTCVSSESQWFNFLIVPLFAVAYCVYLRARPPRWPIMIIVSACGYVINYSLSCWADAPVQVLQVVPAFGLGLIGNCLSKFTGKMSFDAVLLGVFYLVPSSLGLKAAIGLFGGSTDVGNQGAGFALAMIQASIGITLGLFLATLIVYPKGAQHTPLMSL